MTELNKNSAVSKKTLINNSLSGVVQLVITAVLTFLCIPIFINKLGTELYGVFAIVSVIGNLNIFANLGLNSALIKYISEQGKCSESENDIFASLVIMCSIIIPLTILAFIFREFILVSILSVPIKYYEQSQVLYTTLLISNMLLLIGQIFSAVLDSMQKIYFTNFSQLIYSIIYWGGIIIVVLMGHHLDWVGYAMLAAALCWFFLILIFFLKKWGIIAFTNLKGTFKPAAKKQLTFGVKVYLSGFIGFFNEPLFKILISHFLGLNVVAYFEIGLKIRTQLTSLFSKLLQPLYPYLSSLKDKQYIAVLIKDLTSKIFLVVLPVCALLIFTCKDIVTLWLQIDVINYSIFITGLVIPYLIFSPLTLPIYIFLLAKGYPERTIVFQMLSVIVNILAFYFLFSLTGMYTVIISNVLSYLASYILGIYYQNKFLNIKYEFKVKYILRIACVLLLLTVIGLTSLAFNKEMIRILYTIIIFIPLIVWSYKRLELVNQNDFKRYFGGNILIMNIFNKI
ncbi:oligosaccharide flippase family protein [uncultured Bacteroides sp.]|uniref:oligosaccharide flippase family protein n=1 Tax=uncultured Bacteroides sp. TaxID=162156 RepID=UPI002AAC423A|nr:oligosaccharide flippase family protein [uncultured Bacteroides sp.]